MAKKSHIFQILLTISTKQKHLELGYSSGQGLLQTVITRSSIVQYLRSFSPNNEVASKWCRFGVFFRGF